MVRLTEQEKAQRVILNAKRQDAKQRTTAFNAERKIRSEVAEANKAAQRRRIIEAEQARTVPVVKDRQTEAIERLTDTVISELFPLNKKQKEIFDKAYNQEGEKALILSQELDDLEADRDQIETDLNIVNSEISVIQEAIRTATGEYKKQQKALLKTKKEELKEKGKQMADIEKQIRKKEKERIAATIKGKEMLEELNFADQREARIRDFRGVERLDPPMSRGR